MRKILLLIAMVAMSLLQISAKEISQAEAENVAQKFVAQSGLLKNVSASDLKLAHIEQLNERNCVYVFNRGENQGYILVSGDDNAVPVLGYSDFGAFDVDNMPENLKWWLGEYAREIEYASAYEPSTDIVPMGFDKDVAPLLGETKWDQDAPYNNLCPLVGNVRTVTGCMATAMAQIMYYHKWPKTGTGSNSYSWNNSTLSADFSSVTFDWDNMTPTYSASSTVAQQNAVATLMYYVGIAVDMQYGLSANGGSGAASSKALPALYKYFDYDASMHEVLRDNTSRDEFEAILRNEIDNNRPLMFSGATVDNAGHAFVLDGYNKEGYFHVNWGWSGVSDGYFVITALDPYTQGIGGASSGFNYRQCAHIGIQPDTNTGKFVYSMESTGNFTVSKTSVSKMQSVNFKLDSGTYFYGLQAGTVSMGVGVYDLSGNLLWKKVVNPYSNVELNPNVGFATVSLNSVVLSNDLAEGYYKVYPMFYVKESDEWKKVGVPITKNGYVNLQVTSDKFIFSNEEAAKLQADNFVLSGSLYDERSAIVDVDVTNVGGKDYYGNVALKLCSGNTSTVSQELGTQLINISPENSQTLEFTIAVNVDAGDYILALFDEAGNVAGQMDVTVASAPVAAKLTLTKKSEVPNANAVPKDNIVYRAFVKNTGGAFSGTLTMKIWRIEGTRLYLETSFNQFVSIDTNEEVELEFTGAFAEGVVGNQYRCSLYNGNTELNTSSYGRVVITLVAAGSGVDEIVVDDTDAPAEYYNLQGIKVENPENGIFIKVQGGKATKVVL